MFFASRSLLAEIPDSTAVKLKKLSSEKEKITLLLDEGWKLKQDYPNKAIEMAELCLEIATEESSPYSIDSVYRLKAWAYGFLNNRSMGLKNHLLRVKTLETVDTISVALSNAYYETAAVFFSQNQKGQAINFYKDALAISKKLDNDILAAQIYMVLSEYDVEQEEFDRAIVYLDSATKIWSQIDRLSSLKANSEISKALILSNLGYNDSALTILNANIKDIDQNKFPDYNISSLRMSAEVKANAGLEMDALNLYREALNLAEREKKYFELPSIYKGLAYSYEEVNSDSAFKYLQQYTEINDSVLNVENDKALQELKIQYEDEKKAKEISMLKEQNVISERNEKLAKEKTAQEKRNNRLFLIALIISLLLILAILYFLAMYRKKNKEVARQKELLSIRSKEIDDSIQYAKRIQSALMPSDNSISKLFPNNFIFYKPKDKLSGDFYWTDDVVTSDDTELKLFCVGDCTGHGIPGALVSILGINFLNLGTYNSKVNSTGEALDFINQGIKNSFERSDVLIRDGMDLALGAIETATLKLYYSCAKNPIYIVRNKEIISLKGDKKAIGNDIEKDDFTYKTESFQLIKEDIIYICSDGFQDQFGGPDGKKYKLKRFKNLLVDIHALSMHEQSNALDNELKNWISDKYEQVDDITIMGIKI